MASLSPKVSAHFLAGAECGDDEGPAVSPSKEPSQVSELTRRVSAPTLCTDFTSKDSSTNIFVACRVRPLIPNELKQSATISVMVDTTTNSVKNFGGDHANPEACHKFTYDAVFDMKATQDHVFDRSCEAVVRGVLEGYNGTIFCYGQTATGKTWTMEGTRTGEGRGIIPRAFESLYSHVIKMPKYIECKVCASMVEIYLERISDLLDPNRDPEDLINLPVVEHPVRGLCVQGVIEPCVSAVDELQELFLRGAQNRMVGCTKMNERSSRSHSIFQVHIQALDTRTDSSVYASLNLVDLAGSEKIKRTHASGLTLDEAKKINLSLYTLGTVINALSSGKKGHIPYRDSKLTRMLQDSLGGNTNTAFIVTVSPSVLNAQETLTTLRFGKRAKSVKNAPEANRDVSMQELQQELKRRDMEIIRLNSLLAQRNPEDQAIASDVASARLRNSSGSDCESDSISVSTKLSGSVSTQGGVGPSSQSSLHRSPSQQSLVSSVLDESELTSAKTLQLSALLPHLQHLQTVLDAELPEGNSRIKEAIMSVRSVLDPVCIICKDSATEATSTMLQTLDIFQKQLRKTTPRKEPLPSFQAEHITEANIAAHVSANNLPELKSRPCASAEEILIQTDSPAQDTVELDDDLCNTPGKAAELSSGQCPPAEEVKLDDSFVRVSSARGTIDTCRMPREPGVSALNQLSSVQGFEYPAKDVARSENGLLIPTADAESEPELQNAKSSAVENVMVEAVSSNFPRSSNCANADGVAARLRIKYLGSMAFYFLSRATLSLLSRIFRSRN